MKTQEGLTLIETLIYISIIGIMIQGFITFTLSITGINSKTYVIQEVQANTRIALDSISQKIRTSDDIITPSEGNSTSTLILDMPDANPNLSFIIIDGILNIAVGTTTTPITSNRVNISNLIFTNLTMVGGKDNIKIEITANYRMGESKELQYSQTLQTSASLRK